MSLIQHFERYSKTFVDLMWRGFHVIVASVVCGLWLSLT